MPAEPDSTNGVENEKSPVAGCDRALSNLLYL